MTTTTSVQLTAAIDVPESFVNEYIDVYKHLHAHPELSGQEFETAAYIETHLAALGIDSFRCGVTGVVAVLRNGDGPVVGFRADTDCPSPRRRAWITPARPWGRNGTVPSSR